MTAPLVMVDKVSVSYRHGDDWLKALDSVSLEMAAGETLGLAGEFGCGKSTLAYQVMGYRHPNSRLDGGKLLFQGADVLRMDRATLMRLRGNRIGLVPQNPTTALSPGMSVGDQVAEALTGHGKGRNEAGERTHELFALVGLPNPDRIGRRYPHQLSGGQQQRVVIAMALACSPDLLVLDEPTTGLDVTTQRQILDLLKDLRARVGMAMLYVTHDLGVLAEIADRVGVMYAGHVVEIAPTDEIFAHPRHPYTRGLIASRPQFEQCGDRPMHALRGLLRRQELPAGCAFAPRCDHAELSCSANRQSLEAVSPSHEVACQRWRMIAGPEAVAPAVTGDADAAAATNEPLLRLDGVSLGYAAAANWLSLRAKRLTVVDDLSFAIEPGETFALVGESGSGKSTVARAISGLIPPLSGTMRFKGEALPGSIRRRSNAARREIQYIFQNPDASLNPRATVGSILARPLQVFFKADRATAGAKIARALEDVRLDPGYARRYPDQLSGGERQRIAIARAIVAGPLLLLCDEVLSALDVSVQASIIELLRRLRREHHLAMLFISHDLIVVRSLADRVGVLFGGKLVEIGATADIFAPPYHPYTLSLLAAVPGASIGSIGAPARRVDEVRRLSHGCVFAGRCPWKIGPVCDEEPPPWQTTAAGLRIRCHIPEDQLRSPGITEGPVREGSPADDRSRDARAGWSRNEIEHRLGRGGIQ